MDFDTLHLLVTTQWQSAEQNIDQILASVGNCLDELSQLPEERATQIRDALPLIFSKLFSCRRILNSPALQESLNSVVSSYLRVLLPRFSSSPNDVLDAIVETLKNEAYFSQVSYDEPRYHYHQQPEPNFKFLIHQTQILVKYNLFQEIIETLNKPDPPVKFLKNSLHLLVCVRRGLPPADLEIYAQMYRDRVFFIFINLEDEQLKNVTKQDVSTVVSYVERTCKRIFQHQPAVIDDWNTQNEQFCTDFALKCFKSSFLEKRVHGLAYIEEAVRDTNMNWHKKKKVSLKWILDSQIFESLFDIKTTRDELITKGKPIIKFVVEEGAVSDEMFRLMWQCAADKFLSVASIDALCSIVGFSSRYTNLIWEQLQSFPPQDWTEHLVNSAFRLLEHDQQTRASPLLALAPFASFFIQKIIFDPSTSIDVIQVSMDKVISFLKQRSARQSFWGVLIEGLMQDSRTQRIYLIRGLLDPNASLTINNQPARPLMRSFLGEFEVPLLQQCVHELCDYKNHFWERLLQEHKEKGDKVMGNVYHGRFSHKFSLTTRLNFLLNCIDLQPKKERTLSPELIDLIGGSFLHPSRSIPPEREIVLEWFRKLCLPSLNPRKKGTAMERAHLLSDSIRYFFDRWLCQAQNYPSFTMKKAECFQAYFAAVNSKCLIIKPDSFNAMNGANFVCNEFPYHGHEHLYDMILNAQNSDVFAYGKTIFIKLFTKFTDNLAERLPEIGNSFLKLLLASLFEMTEGQQSLSKGNVQAIDRVILLLKQYLDATNAPLSLETSQQPKVVINQPAQVTSRYQPTLMERELVATIMEFCGVSIEVATLAIRQYHSVENAVDRLSSDENVALRLQEQVFQEESKSGASTQQKVAVPENPIASEYVAPSFLLSNDPQFFNVLLGLLEQPGLNKTNIWEIVNSLPPNQELQEKIWKLEAPNFETLFDIKSVFKFLYILQIIDGIMEPKGSSPSETQLTESKAWCKEFFQSKGFQFLYNLIEKLDVSDCQNTIRSGAYKQCLVFLLKIVQHFLSRTFKNVPADKEQKLALSQGSAQLLASTLDFSQLVTTLLTLSWNLMTAGLNSEDAKVNNQVVTYCIELLSNTLLSQPKLMDLLYSNLNIDFKTFVLTSLTKSSKEVSRAWANGWAKVLQDWNCDTTQLQPLDFFEELLISNYPWDASGSAYAAYYQLLASVLQFKAKQAKGNSEDRFSAFVTRLVSVISESAGDKSENVEDQDATLNGALIVLRAYFQTSAGQLAKNTLGDKLMQQTFDICVLTADDKIALLKCLTPETRRSAFDLLLELTVENFELYKKLIVLLTPCIRIPTKDEQHKIATLPKSKTGKYVGLVNLGVTCYANCFMQQFFMIPEFRAKILQLQITDAKKQPVVSQVQKMFANLQESQREFFETTDFMKSLSDIFDVRDQQDTYEFYNVLCEKMERELEGTDQAQILNDVFGGELQREIICERNHKTFGSESIQNISVEIHKMSNLDEALDGFFEGEKIQDFRCQECGMGVPITKQFSVKKLPRTLVIQLKRFQFDVEFRSKTKIFDKFSYPIDLDLTKYLSKESPPSDESKPQPDPKPQQPLSAPITKYRLVGVVVHKGGADAGHYFSYIEDRTHHRWFKFDDKSVTDFDPKNLEKETFGADQQAQYQHYYGHHGHHQHFGCGGWHGHRQMAQHQHQHNDKQGTNAYMLVYEQVVEQNLRASQGQVDPHSLIPPQILNSIKEENILSSKLRLKFDPLYFDFFKQIIQRLSFEPIIKLDPSDFVLATIQQATRYVFEIVSASAEALWRSWMETLIQHFSKHIPAAKWFLATLIPPQTNWLFDFLVTKDIIHVRKYFSDLIIACVNVLDKNEIGLPLEAPIKAVEVVPLAPPKESSLAQVLPTSDDIEIPPYLVPANELLTSDFKQFASNPTTIQVLQTILNNALENPSSPEYLLIPKNSEMFHLYITNEGALPFLLRCGFKPVDKSISSRGPILALTNFDFDLIKIALKILEPKPVAQQEPVPVKSVQQGKVVPPLDINELMQINVGRKFLLHMIDIRESARKQAANFHQYWSLLARSTQLSHQLREFFVQERLGEKIMDQYMGGSSPIWKAQHQHASRTPLGSAYHSKLEEMMDVLAHLVRACHTSATLNADCPPPPTSYSGVPLIHDRSDARKWIFYNESDFSPLKSILETEYSANCNRTVFSHYCWEDIQTTKLVLSTIQKIRSQAPKAQVVLEALIALQDSVCQQRTALMFSGSGGLIDELTQFPVRATDLLQAIERWLIYPHVAGYLHIPKIRERFIRVIEGIQGRTVLIESWTKFLEGDHDYQMMHYPDNFQLP